MDAITFLCIVLAAFVCEGANTNKISVQFAVKDCTNDCIEATNQQGKVRIYGYDKNHPIQGGGEREFKYDNVETYEIIEQPFTATSVPFTLDIVYPDDPESLIQAGMSELWGDMPVGKAAYFIDILWDADNNYAYACEGDVQIDGNPKTDAVVDLNAADTQTIYIKRTTENGGTCEGEIQVVFKTKDCESVYCRFKNGVERGEATVSLYGYDDTMADVSATLIRSTKVMIYGTVAQQTVQISYPENPVSLIQPKAEEKNAKFYVSMEKCDLGTDFDEGFPNVDLTAGDNQIQTVYIKETVNEDIPCGAVCYQTTFVKVLLGLYFVFYIFV